MPPIESRRSFGSNRPAPKVGPEFEIGGDWGSETFHCKGAVAGRIVPDFVAQIAVGNRALSNPNVVTFIAACLATDLLVSEPSDDNPDGTLEPCDDLERWNQLMDDDARPVHAQDLGDIAMWLVSWYQQRPTTPSRH